jgi:hypothetical protein
MLSFFILFAKIKLYYFWGVLIMKQAVAKLFSALLLVGEVSVALLASPVPFCNPQCLRACVRVYYKGGETSTWQE